MDIAERILRRDGQKMNSESRIANSFVKFSRSKCRRNAAWWDYSILVATIPQLFLAARQHRVHRVADPRCEDSEILQIRYGGNR
jgi:hypothetical protein